jgi:hypothetical protein
MALFATHDAAGDFGAGDTLEGDAGSGTDARVVDPPPNYGGDRFIAEMPV